MHPGNQSGRSNQGGKSLFDVTYYKNSRIKTFAVHNPHHRTHKYSARTLALLSFLAVHKGSVKACFLAKQLNQPRHSVHKTLSRLAENGVLIRTKQGFSLSEVKVYG